MLHGKYDNHIQFILTLDAPCHLMVWGERNRGRQINPVSNPSLVSEPCACKGLRREDSRIWGILQISTHRSGHGESLPLKQTNTSILRCLYILHSLWKHRKICYYQVQCIIFYFFNFQSYYAFVLENKCMRSINKQNYSRFLRI